MTLNSKFYSVSLVIAFVTGCLICGKSTAQTKIQLEGVYADIAEEIESLNCDNGMEDAWVIIWQRFDFIRSSQQGEEKDLQNKKLRLLFLLLWKKTIVLEAEINKTEVPEILTLDFSHWPIPQSTSPDSSHEKAPLDIPFRMGMSPDDLPDGQFKTSYKNHLEAIAEHQRVSGIKSDLADIQDLMKRFLLSQESLQLARENIEDEEFNNYLIELYEKEHAAKLNKQH